MREELDSPALRWPTTSARLPFLTLVMKAPSLPVSVIFPPTTCTDTNQLKMGKVYRELINATTCIADMKNSIFLFCTWFMTCSCWRHYSEERNTCVYTVCLALASPLAQAEPQPLLAWLFAYSKWFGQLNDHLPWRAAM